MTTAAHRKIIILIWGLIASGPLGAQASPAGAGPAEAHTVASAQRSVRPDLAVFTITFTGTGRTPRGAGQAVAARADSLRRSLETLGIPHDSLMTGSRWYWWRGRIEVVYGPSRYFPPPAGVLGPGTRVQDTLYRATDAIEVRVHDLTKVGPAIDAALALGITDISSIQFTATHTDSTRADALRDATIAARRQADVIARAAGAHLGRTLALSTTPDYDFGGTVMSVASARGGSNQTDVVQPMIPVNVSVTGRWELIDDR